MDCKLSVIPVPIYDIDVMVHIGESKKVFKALQELYQNTQYLNEIESKASVHELWSNLEELEVILQIEFDATPEIIAHECLHLTYIILDRVGIEITSTNHEAQAYLLMFLVKEVNQALSWANGV